LVVTEDSLPLQTRKKWDIPNELCYEKNDVALRAGREMWESQFVDLRFRSISNTYNCVGMVIASRRVWVQPAHLFRILADDGYRRLPGPEAAECGDVVIYQDGADEEPTHVGIVLRKKVIMKQDEDSLVVLSKWGAFGEYEHESQYVPVVYGRPTQFWTDRRTP
jgi:hypothetical protein